MGALAIALVIMAVIFFCAVLLVAAGRWSHAANKRAGTTAHPMAPSYTPQSRHTEYYRPEEEQRKEDTPSVSAKSERNRQPLPRCPLCDAAVGFDDDKCPKCRHVLRDF